MMKMEGYQITIFQKHFVISLLLPRGHLLGVASEAASYRLQTNTQVSIKQQSKWET